MAVDLFWMPLARVTRATLFLSLCLMAHQLARTSFHDDGRCARKIRNAWAVANIGKLLMSYWPNQVTLSKLESKREWPKKFFGKKHGYSEIRPFIYLQSILVLPSFYTFLSSPTLLQPHGPLVLFHKHSWPWDICTCCLHSLEYCWLPCLQYFIWVSPQMPSLGSVFLELFL